MSMNTSAIPQRRIFRIEWLVDDGASFDGLSIGVSTDGIVDFFIDSTVNFQVLHRFHCKFSFTPAESGFSN
jgi:hypothetical protein